MLRSGPPGGGLAGQLEPGSPRRGLHGGSWSRRRDAASRCPRQQREEEKGPEFSFSLFLWSPQSDSIGRIHPEANEIT